MAQCYDNGRRKAAEKESNGCTVTELESEVAENLGQCLANFGWGDERLDSVKGVSNAKV